LESESDLLLSPKLRMTRQRQAILEELRNADWHPTADEVYERVRRRLPRISLGTVYRNLEILSESGMIRKLDFGGAKKRFDSKLEDHYHVRCISCGRVEDIPVKPLTMIQDAFNDVRDYQIIGHQLVLIGLCPVCKKREQDPHKESHERHKKEK
jgi:Fur family ferric uptake transcriptional regulator